MKKVIRKFITISVISILCLATALVLWSAGVAQSGPILFVDPTSIDFGDAAAGSQFTSQPLIIRNNGASDLTVYAMQLVGGDPDEFRLVTAGFPFTLAAADTTAMGITFAPTSPGGKSAALRIVTNDPNAGIVDVQLSGNGIGQGNLGQVTARPIPGSSTVVPTTQFNVAIEVDMSGANPSGSLLQSYQARLSWDPDVLVYSGFDPLIQFGNLPVAVGSAPAGTGEIEWYGAALVGSGSGGVADVITFSFLVTGGVGTSSPLTLEILEAESSNVEDLRPIMSVSNSSVQVVSNGTPPDIFVEPESLDYDSVTIGSSATQNILVRNDGVEDLAINNVAIEGSNADQFDVESGGDSFTLPAGKSQEVVVSFNPASADSKNAAVRFDSNDPDENPLTVSVVGSGTSTSVPDINLNPASHDFGNMSVGESGSQSFTVLNQGAADLNVDSATLVGEAVSQFAITSGGAPFTLAPGGSRDLTVQFNPNDPGYEEMILRFSSNDPGENPFDVEITSLALFEGDIMVAPLALNFGNVVLGSLVSQNVSVFNEGTLPFQVVSIGLSGGPQNDFSFGQNTLGYIQPGESATISVNFVPVSAGSKNGTLQIFSEDSDEKLIEVSLSGTGIAVPDILVAPSGYDYGSVAVGASAAQNFSVRNVGTADLSVQSPALTGSDAGQFSITNGGSGVSLSMGQTHNVTVDFAPSSGGSKSANLQLGNNDPGENPTNILLSGSGGGGGSGGDPSVTLTSPSDGATVAGSVNVTANASNADQVEFFVDGSSIGMDTTAPYAATWNTTGTSNGGHTISATASGNGQTASDSVSITVDNQSGGGGGEGILYVSSSSTGNVGGVAFSDEDILAFDSSNGSWSLYIDGSDVGLGDSSARDIDAFHLMDDGSFLLSLVGATTISNFGDVDDSDILRFVPFLTGDMTLGFFEWYVDGSDIGLDSNGEDVDSVTLLPDGRIVMSTVGRYSVSGASGADEDLIVFTPVQLGATTSGTWEIYFDGSDVGLNSSYTEDVWGAWVDNASGEIYLTTRGAFSVNGASGDGADIFVCAPSSTGSNSGCTFSSFWDSSANGFGGEIMDGVHIATQQIRASSLDEPESGHIGVPDDTADGDSDPTNGDIDDETLLLPFVVR